MIQSYRSLPLGQRVLVGGGVAVVAILLLLALPHIVGAVVGFAFLLVTLAVLALIVAACVVGIVALVRALGQSA
ncbi:MAG: hypothetical protein WAM30_10725 [Candidatus Dormiibacterota bacterium]